VSGNARRAEQDRGYPGCCHVRKIGPCLSDDASGDRRIGTESIPRAVELETILIDYTMIMMSSIWLAECSTTEHPSLGKNL